MYSEGKKSDCDRVTRPEAETFMKTILWILIAVAAGLGISCGTVGKAELKKDDGAIQMGDRVLAPDRDSQGTFTFEPMREAVVGRIDGPKAIVHYLDKIDGRNFTFDRFSQRSEVNTDDLVKLPLTPDPLDSFKVGDKVLLLSNSTTRLGWNAAEIAAVEKNRITSIFISGSKSSRITRTDEFVNGASPVIKLPERLMPQIRSEAGDRDTLQEKGAFLDSASSHYLIMDKTYTPRIGDQVLVLRRGEGKVIAVNNNSVDVMHGKNQTEITRGLVNYVPLAALKNPPPVSVDAIVTVRPESGVEWEYAKVTAVNGDTLEVKVSGITRRTVRKGDYYPLN
jgi:hypothetical protein